MRFFFADDSRQPKPSRDGMGPLVSVGGISVPYGVVGEIERKINGVCDKYGFPDAEPFKWSPGRELWMTKNLINAKRKEFFLEVLGTLKKYKVTAIVAIEDEKYKTAAKEDIPHEQDVTKLFLERVDNYLNAEQCDGIVISDRPGDDKEKFILNCFKTIREGTRQVKIKRICLNVLPIPSKFIRLLQCADLITSCTVARVSGENNFSPDIFDKIRDIFIRNSNRIGGVGLKIHPDFKYANLYHWLAGDSHFWKSNCGTPMPIKECKYSSSENIY